MINSWAARQGHLETEFVGVNNYGNLMGLSGGGSRMSVHTEDGQSVLDNVLKEERNTVKL